MMAEVAQAPLAIGGSRQLAVALLRAPLCHVLVAHLPNAGSRRHLRRSVIEIAWRLECERPHSVPGVAAALAPLHTWSICLSLGLSSPLCPNARVLRD